MMQEQFSIDDISLRDIWNAVKNRRRLVLAFMASGFVLSLVISLMLPNIYQAKTTILPPQQDASFGSMVASQLPSALGGFSGLINTKSQADVWVSILDSKRVKDSVILKFGLKDQFGAKTMDAARARLDRHVSVTKGKEDIITVRVQSEDPKKAAEMANHFVLELDKVNQLVGADSGVRSKEFVEQRLVEAKRDFTKAEEALKVFQENYRAVSLDEQSKAIFDAIGTIKGNLIAKEVELETFLSFATQSHPNVNSIKAEIKELKQKLKEMERGQPDGQKDVFIPTSQVPALGMRLAGLMRDVKVQETLYGMLIQQYEMAKLQENRNVSTLHVLDVATPPEEKFKPKRAIIIIVSTIGAGFAAVLAALVMEFLSRARREDGLS